MSLARENAISSLRDTLQTLLDSGFTPGQGPDLMVLPQRIRHTGIGGLVGIHDDPVGDVIGLTVDARVVVQASANSIDTVSTDIGTAAQLFQGLGRVELLENKISRMALTEVGAVQELGNGQFCRQISFNVHYEFEQLPEQSSGSISELILRHEVGLSPSAKFLANLFFDSDPLAHFTPVDDPAATTDAPSQWRYNELQARVEQLSRIRGGTLSLVDYQKAGTYLLLNGASCRDFILNMELFSDSVDGVGAILRWRDVDNFYFFLMSNRGSGYRIFGKKVDGSFAALTNGGERVDIEYPRDRRIALKIILAGSQFQALMDEVVILRGEDSDIDSPGQVGFMTQGNDDAHFFNLNLTSFDSD